MSTTPAANAEPEESSASPSRRAWSRFEDNSGFRSIEDDVNVISRGRKGSTPHDWRSTLTVTLAALVCCSGVPSAPAQNSEPPTVMASLSVSRIQPEFFPTGVREPTNGPAPRTADRTDWPVITLNRPPTDAEAWEKFDSEFRPEYRSTSPVKRQIETVKFGLDTTVFAVDRFVKSIRDHADFNFDQGACSVCAQPFPEGFWATRA